MPGEITRRGLLWTTGAVAVGIGCGVPFVRALARELESDEGSTSRWAMIVDTKKCAQAKGCTACMDACHRIHNVPKIDDPEEEVKWIWKESFDHVFPDQDNPYLDPEVRSRAVPVLCNHCDDPPCVRVCPTKATWKRGDGIVMMDMHRCIGCRYCIVGCPYGSRSFNWKDPRPHIAKIDEAFPTRSKGVVEKCNFCAEKGRLSRDGTWTPECVARCPEKALIWGDIRDPEGVLRKALADRLTIRRRAGLGTRPHVFYLV